MNKILREYYDLFELYQALRSQLMALLHDDDMTFTPGGDNLTLGALCQEMGEVEYSYIQSFKTLTQNFDYRNDQPGLAGSVASLSTWFAALDEELKATISGFSDEELQTKIVDRGHNFKLPIHIQLEVYKEALLIFYGKVSVYLKMMGKERPHQWQEWIA